MRFLLTLLFLSVLCTCARAQVGNRVDAEYASWCMVDSLATGEVIRFTRLVNIATLDVKDIDPVAGTAYVVAGSLYTCEEYDLAAGTRSPINTVYGDECSCTYEITQEQHRVSDIRGGSSQEYTVQFEEIVTRKCVGESERRIVSSQTRSVLKGLNGPYMNYAFTAAKAGDYIDQMSVRVYQPGTAPAIVSIDLNPNTVQASYPGLSITSTDLESGNAATFAAAVTLVMNYAVTQFAAAPQNSLIAIPSVGQVQIRATYLHEPSGVYVVLPTLSDPFFEFVGSGITMNNFQISDSCLNTDTERYSEYCTEEIYSRFVGCYVSYNPEQPTQLRIIDLNDAFYAPSVVSAFTNDSITCEAPPEVCGELMPDEVDVGGCLDLCSEVVNIAGHLPLSGIDTTLAAGAYNSISIYVTQGPVGVTLRGERINYPSGWSNVWSAQAGKLLSNSIRFDATGAEAIISYIQ